jgi:TetR/AcrR family transcriptional regulator, lmrAB and yxaGH operons repressor
MPLNGDVGARWRRRSRRGSSRLRREDGRGDVGEAGGVVVGMVPKLTRPIVIVNRPVGQELGSPLVATDTRDRLIRATGRLLRSHGYAGTGLNQVTAEARAPRGSMYFHFPGGKQELAAAAVDRFADRITARWRDLLATSATVADAVSAYFDALAGVLRRSDLKDGCAVATVALEASPTHEPLAEATRRALETWTQLLTDALEAEGHEPEAAHGLAVLVISALEGSLVVAKGQRSVDPVVTIRDTLRPLLAPPGKRRRPRPS